MVDCASTTRCQKAAVGYPVVGTTAAVLRLFNYATFFIASTGEDISIRSRIALPGLKCGMCFGGTTTDSPVFGFLPVRAGR